MSPVINTNVVWTELAWENYFLLGMFVIDFSLLIGGWWGRGGMQPDCDLLPIKGTFVSQLNAPTSSLIPPAGNDPTPNAPAGAFLRIPSHTAVPSWQDVQMTPVAGNTNLPRHRMLSLLCDLWPLRRRERTSRLIFLKWKQMFLLLCHSHVKYLLLSLDNFIF